MRLMLPLALALSVVACSKKTDRCKQVIDKSVKVLGEMAALRGQKLGKKERAQLVEQCRKATKEGHTDPAVDCVLAAKDDAGVRNCYMQGYEKYLERSKEIEAPVQLAKLGKNARAYFAEKAGYPVGKIGPTPAEPCCAQQMKQCVPSETMWSDPLWQALGFAVDGTFGFQYSYESTDGKTFTATAIGDVGCSGTPKTVTIHGSVDAQGAPQVTKP